MHSHLNHSCAPSVSVRHFDQKTALSRITLISRRDIEVGEELLVTYVNPALGVWERRRSLEEWGFGLCQCERCILEEKEAPADQNATDDLAEQLKAGLGIF